MNILFSVHYPKKDDFMKIDELCQNVVL